MCYGCDDDGSLGINNTERINRLKHPGAMAKKWRIEEADVRNPFQLADRS
jgi:hypothetical protein